MLHELPLVIFTIVAQMCVGAFVTLGLIHVFGAKVPAHVMDEVSDPALYVLGPLLVLGLAASTLHLGTPIRAINALRHVGTSWLSNEIVAGMAFLVTGAAFAVTQWFKLGSARLRQMLAGLAAVVGVALVWCISQVYSLRTVPAWNTWFTPARFFITAMLLGSLSVGAVLVIATLRWRRRPIGSASEVDAGTSRGRFSRAGSSVLTQADAEDGERLLVNCVRGIAAGAGVLLGFKFIGLPLYLTYLGTHPDPAAARTLHLLGETYRGFALLEYVLIFAGIALLGALLVRLSRGRVSHGTVFGVALGAFVLVFAGEFIGRMLFYATMARTGL